MSAPRNVLPTLTEVVPVEQTLPPAPETAPSPLQEAGGPRSDTPDALEKLCLEALQRELEPLLQARLEAAMAPAVDRAIDVLAARLKDQMDLLAQQLRVEMEDLLRTAAARAAASVAPRRPGDDT